MLGPFDARCPPGEIRGPYTLEFLYDPRDTYNHSGTNKRIDVFAIDGDIPQMFDGHREFNDVPTWTNIGPLTGARLGSFEIPREGKKRVLTKVVEGVQGTCRKEYNFRLSFADGEMGAESVVYYQKNETGLRLRFGC